MTESKTPLTSEKMSKSDAKISSNKKATKTSAPKKSSTQQSSPNNSPSKISKLAIFAVLIAIAAPSGHYYWQQLQHQQLTNKISEENNVTLSQYQSQLQQALTKQQQSFDQQLQQVVAQIHNNNDAKITELTATVAQLEHSIKQRQPSDWLLHEAEYLIRIAARSLWLEHDARAAIGLLKDADTRLTELNDPAFLPVREVIHQDIKSLELMPTLQTDDIVLTLMALSKQVMELPLAIESLGKEKDEEPNLELSNDINDWQSNLAKTWQKFLDDFIRVRQRTGTVEPLMSPEKQTHLKENLSLKIQLTLWAASERKKDIYQKSLDDILQWLNEFFDMKNNINLHFAKTLTDLKKKQVNYDYPNELGALTAIRATLRNQSVNLPSASKKKAADVENKLKSDITKEIKTESTKPVKLPAQQPEQQNDKSKSEGSI